MKILILFIALCLCLPQANAQRFNPNRKEDPIPRDMDAMYVKGLKYLAKSQNKQGSWSDSGASNYPGVVGLCLLAFLAHGDDPNHGPYKKNIKLCIDYIIKCQKKNGFIDGTGPNSYPNMYNHGFATLALAEAYGMVKHDKIEEALKKAVDLILTAQKRNPKGAWRYSPTAQDADSTVAGCQLVALYAARNAGIDIPDEAFTKAHKYMESCRSKSSGAYGYTSPSGARQTLTAIGLLCQSFAKKHKSKSYQQSFAYLKKNLNYRDKHYSCYFEYYMSQALFHADEETWKEWNRTNIKWLKNLQQPDGSFNANYGKAYGTSASLLSLALNYRFLPIYEK